MNKDRMNAVAAFIEENFYDQLFGFYSLKWMIAQAIEYALAYEETELEQRLPE